MSSLSQSFRNGVPKARLVPIFGDDFDNGLLWHYLGFRTESPVDLLKTDVSCYNALLTT